MSSDQDDSFAADDDASDVPAYEGTSRSDPRRKLPVAALLLSLMCHAAAGAALTTWAWCYMAPTLHVAGGAGAGTASVAMEDSIVAPETPSLGDASVEPLFAAEFQPAGLTNSSDDFGPPLIGFSSAISTSTPTSASPWVGLNPSPLPLPQPRARLQDVQGSSGDGTAAGGTPIPASTNRPPRYPREALQRQWQGTVVVEVEVAEGGDVRHARLASSSGHAILDEAALDAVRQWRFNGDDGAGLSFAWTGTVPVEFVLKKRT
jgi:protein TonB